jgi:FKBP-type peptidyl-prolyl cis-trans isomerase FklB
VSIRSCLLALCVVCVAAWVIAQEALPDADPLAGAPPTDARHYSYAIGRQIGSSFRDDSLELDVDSLAAGLRDGLSGAEPQFPAELCDVALQRMYMQQQENYRQRNADFLAQNAKAEGVVTLPSGLQYKILAEGTGASPMPTSTVSVNYVGSFIDGDVFDQSQPGEPAQFKLDAEPGVIDGWKEALLLMKVGDKWQLFLPSELAYGEFGSGDAIPPHAALIFEVELLGIE